MYADSVCVCVCDNTNFLFPLVISETVLPFACYDRLLLLAVEKYLTRAGGRAVQVQKDV